jgi:ClpP class serine protease
MDRSAAVEKAGLKPTLLHAGAYKIDGSPFAALPDDARASIQASIDGVYDLFVSSVAQHRKGLDAAAVRATEAGVFMGQAAVDAKLADAVGTLEAVMSDLKAGRVPVDAAQARLPAPGALGGAGWPEQRDRIKAILGHEKASGCIELAQHIALETDMSLEAAVLVFDAAPAIAPAAASPPPKHVGRLMRDPASDTPARNSAAAMGALSPEEVARRVSGAL